MNFENVRAVISQVNRNLIEIINTLERQNKFSVLSNLALHYLDKPYIWGGNFPGKGSDCSGFVCFLLQSHGILKPSEDLNSDTLLSRFPRVKNPAPGCLVFYGKPIVTHVMFCLNDFVCIGASGGNRQCVSADIAERQEARIMIKPIDYRPDLLGFNNPLDKFQGDLSIWLPHGGY